MLMLVYKIKWVFNHRLLLNLTSKAFNQISWSFLLQALESLGFSDSWCMIIKTCITSSYLSFNLDRAPFGFVKLERSLRQGDPLSPLLFVTCLEYLSRLLGNLENNKKHVGVQLSPKSPIINHPLFVNDFFYFVKLV